MFDEYNEGNQIAKTSETQATTPAGANIRSLDEDGTFCSSDYYLRITADGGRMLKGQLALTPNRPTQPTTGDGPPDPPTGNLALNKPTSASSQNGGFVAGNAVDTNVGSYWESANGAFPQWLQVDLGTAALVNRVVLKLPPGWETRTQTILIQGSTNGSQWTTLAPSAGVTFNPASGNTATLTVLATQARYVRLTVTGNTGWPAAQVAQFEVYGGTSEPGSPPTAPGNLTVTGKTTTTVSLSWTASSDDTGVVGYDVRQGSAVVGSPGGTSYTVTGLSPNTSYTFSVVARDNAGNLSSPSNAVTVTTNAPPVNTNLALGRPTAESGHTQAYGSVNVVDGNANSYWESPNNSFPQWVQVDLGAATAVGRVVLKLPPQSAWQTRTQTLSIQGSTTGSSWSTLAGSAGRVFDPATGNAGTVTFAATSTRYVRIHFTANTGWPAGQLSELEVYAT
jgi:chitodextrinase